MRRVGLFSSRCDAERLAAADLAGAGHLEPLGGTAVRLHLAASWSSARIRGCQAWLRRRGRCFGGCCNRCSAARPVLAGAAAALRRTLPALGPCLRAPGRVAGPWSCCGRPGGVPTRRSRSRRPRSATRSRISPPELGVGHLPTPEHDRELDLEPSPRKRSTCFILVVVVVAVDLGPELHLLDDDVRRLPPRLLAPLLLLVLVLAVVHDPADRRVGLVGDLDEVEALLSGDLAAPRAAA